MVSGEMYRMVLPITSPTETSLSTDLQRLLSFRCMLSLHQDGIDAFAPLFASSSPRNILICSCFCARRYCLVQSR